MATPPTKEITSQAESCDLLHHSSALGYSVRTSTSHIFCFQSTWTKRAKARNGRSQLRGWICSQTPASPLADQVCRHNRCASFERWQFLGHRNQRILDRKICHHCHVSARLSIRFQVVFVSYWIFCMSHSDARDCMASMGRGSSSTSSSLSTMLRTPLRTALKLRYKVALC